MRLSTSVNKINRLACIIVNMGVIIMRTKLNYSSKRSFHGVVNTKTSRQKHHYAAYNDVFVNTRRKDVHWAPINWAPKFDVSLWSHWPRRWVATVVIPIWRSTGVSCCWPVELICCTRSSARGRRTTASRPDCRSHLQSKTDRIRLCQVLHNMLRFNVFSCVSFQTQFLYQAICTYAIEPQRKPSNRRLYIWTWDVIIVIYIRQCQDSNSQPAPSQVRNNSTIGPSDGSIDVKWGSLGTYSLTKMCKRKKKEKKKEIMNKVKLLHNIKWCFFPIFQESGGIEE